MRIHKWLLVLVALVPVGSNSAIADTVQWKPEDGGNGHWYELVASPVTWSNAKVAAEGMVFLGVSGHLVTLTSAEENEFVFSNVYDRALHEAAWIGLTDDEAFGGYESFGQPNFKVDGWVWVTGEPVEFTSWSAFWNSSGEWVEEPNNFDNDDYALMHRYIQSGWASWNDQTSYATFPYVVEYDVAPVPAPSTFAGFLTILLTVGLIRFSRRRRKNAA